MIENPGNIKIEKPHLVSREQLKSFMGFNEVQSIEEGQVQGKALRKTAHRSSWADWQPAADRPDIVDLLVSQGRTRIPELLPLRYERMGASAFTFYRGNALGMACDLSTASVSGLNSQICGDAHVANFGRFASPDRRLLFDINDFDETSIGPWEWDVARLAASLEICARDRAFDTAHRTQVVRAAVETYRSAMNQFAQMGNLTLWYKRLEFEGMLDMYAAQTPKAAVKVVRRAVDKSKNKDNTRAAIKFTNTVDGKLRIISQPPLIVPLEELRSEISPEILNGVMHGVITAYKKSLTPDIRCLLNQYRYIDCARKVVGVGSVGTRCWIIVLQGRDENDSLVLQVKEAEDSVIERYLEKNVFLQHGRRVVEGQRLMQASGDIMLGWVTAPAIDGKPHDFYVRQLWDWKSSTDLNTIDEAGLLRLGQMCAWTLARAHARSGNRFAISGYLGSGTVFDKAMTAFAATYADVNERDYARFQESCADGTLPLPPATDKA